MINDISSNRLSKFANQSDRIFSYLEKEYPEFLAPANRLDAVSTCTEAVSSCTSGYYYRYYPATNAYIATSNGEVFYLGPASGNQVFSLGSVQNLLLFAYDDDYSFSPTQ
jgi:hypothetical protein